MKKEKKLPPVRETVDFEKFTRYLRNQTPEQHERLREMLDEIMDDKAKEEYQSLWSWKRL